MNQREVWDSIAVDWNKKRTNPVPDTIDFLKNKKGLILDVGCGTGRNLVNIEGKIIAIDFSRKIINLAKSNAKKKKLNICFVISDVLELPFRDNSFDVVAASSMLHCIKWNRRNAALKEIQRVARDGADVFISVWNNDQPRFAGAKKEAYLFWAVKGKGYKRYYYLYSKDELESLLKKYFKNVRVFGGHEKAFKKYPKNIIAVARVSKGKRLRHERPN